MFVRVHWAVRVWLNSQIWQLEVRITFEEMNRKRLLLLLVVRLVDSFNESTKGFRYHQFTRDPKIQYPHHNLCVPSSYRNKCAIHLLFSVLKMFILWVLTSISFILCIDAWFQQVLMDVFSKLFFQDISCILDTCIDLNPMRT